MTKEATKRLLKNEVCFFCRNPELDATKIEANEVLTDMYRKRFNEEPKMYMCDACKELWDRMWLEDDTQLQP